MKTVEDVMSTNPIAVRKTCSFREIAGQAPRIPSQCVPGNRRRREGGRCRICGGLAGQGGFGERARRHPEKAVKPDGVTAADLMTSPAVTVVLMKVLDVAIRNFVAKGAS